jgi:hypothetical protein
VCVQIPNQLASLSLHENFQYPHQLMTAMCRHCLLCGNRNQGLTFRTRSVSSMQETLTNHIQETPFLWRHIQEQLRVAKRDSLVDVCAPCMQWLQRACKYASHHSTRYMLLVDQLFMCVLQPGRGSGKTACIQARVYQRILKTLRQKENPLMLICPFVVRHVIMHTLQENHSRPLTHIMQCWWVMNGSPELLPSTEVARAVRFYM